MTIAVTGAVAEDHLMTFPGSFAELIDPERLDALSLSFLVDDLEVRRGGTAANICFGLAQLGIRPLLVAAVGTDFLGDYEPWLSQRGVDTSFVHVSTSRQTSRFICTTDSGQRQLASFYSGAMQEASSIDLGAIAERAGGLDLIVVAPNDPQAMLRTTEFARSEGIPFIADPGQQLASLDGEQVRQLIEGAVYLLCNEYESGLIASNSGWAADEVLARVEVRLTTHGERGCVIEQSGKRALTVPAVPTADGVATEPTGAGDAFRAGFIAARLRGLDLERSAQLGALIATYDLESIGTQEYEIDGARALARFAGSYGQEAASDVEPLLTGAA